MTNPAVTNMEQETRMVTAPHADLLDRARAALTSWQYDAAQAEAAMTQVLAEGDVFLDPDSEPVVPVWWDRTAEGRGMWLVWPAGYARATGKPRRERADDVEAVTEKRRRTIAYRDAWERHGRLLRQIEQAGQDLARLAEKYGW